MKTIIYLLFAVQFSFAQTEKLISGEIICENNKISGIQVTNLVNENSTISNIDGKFSILAKANDMLVFTSINYEFKRKFLEQNDIDSKYLITIISKKIEQLEEVVVNNSPQLDAVKLGILEKPAKEYTVAERRLRTGTASINTMTLDPLINLISGRTKNLKNQLEIEKKELLLSKIANLYNEDYYFTKLKINPDLIKAFQYYAIDDNDFVTALKSKNKTKINFRMIELAQKFNQLQTIEK